MVTCLHKNIRYCRVPDCPDHKEWYCADCNQPVSWALAHQRGAATALPESENFIDELEQFAKMSADIAGNPDNAWIEHAIIEVVRRFRAMEAALEGVQGDYKSHYYYQQLAFKALAQARAPWNPK